MSKKWWKFRVAFWLVGFAFLTYFLIMYSPWRKWFPTAWEKGLRAKYQTAIDQGKPIVEGIYKFRSKYGMWPLEGLGELANLKGEAPAVPPGWSYEIREGRRQLVHKLSDGSFVGFDFDPNHLGWIGWDATDSMAMPQPLPVAATESAGEAYERVLAVHDQRLKSAPTMPEYWQNKASFLYRNGKMAELNAFLQEAKNRRGGFYWSWMALAVLEAERDGLISKGKPTGDRTGAVLKLLPEVTAATMPATSPATQTFATATSPSGIGPAGEAFVKWMVEHPSMTHYFYLHTYARLIGDKAGAMRAVELAEKLVVVPQSRNYPVFVDDPKNPIVPLEKNDNPNLIQTASDDLFPMYYYLYGLALYAYENKQYDLSLAFCARWQLSDQASKLKNPNFSYLPIAAACNLAQGKFEDAKRFADDARFHFNHDQTVWGAGLNELYGAADRKDQAYVYVPFAEGLPLYDVWKMTYE